MLYKKNSAKELDRGLFENPTSEYRGAPFWAWNCRLDGKELERQIEILKEMGFGGFHMHVRSGLETEYLGDEFMDLVKECTGKAEKETAFGVFREGDKVMQVKNDYDKEWEILNMFGVPAKKGIGVFNGDLGIVKSLNHYAEEAEIEFDEGRTAIYSYKEFEELEPKTRQH